MMFFNTYRKKLVALFFLIAMVPIILFGISINTRINQQIISENIKVKTNFVINEAEKLNIWFKINEEKVEDISGNYSFMANLMSYGDSNQRMTDYLASQLISSQEIQNVHITMKNGKEYTFSGKLSQKDTRLSNWYINALLSEDIVWSNTNNDEHNDELLVTASVPLFNNNGGIDGILAADFDFSNILIGLDDINIDKNASTYIVDNSNKLLKAFGSEPLNLEESNEFFQKGISKLFNEIQTDKNGNTSVELEQEYLVFYSTLPSINWRIISFVPRADFYQSIMVSDRDIGAIAIVTIVIVIIMAMFFAETFSRPLKRLKDGAIEIENGNYEYRIDVKSKDEFGDVAGVFNDMTSRLKQSYASLSDSNDALIENNDQLQEMNIELETSYEQLKVTTDQLNESESRYRMLIENMYDLVWMSDSELNITFVNDQVKSILKMDKKEVLGKNLNELIKLCVGYNVDIIDDLKKNDFKNKEITILDKNGNKVNAEITTKRIYENGFFIGIQGVIRDTTERKTMEKDILKRNEELSVINKISKNIDSTMDIGKLLQTATDDIARILDGSLCTIRILNDNSDLKLMASSGEFSELVTHDDVPINARGKALGVLSVDGANKLDKSELSILASIANQIAMKIENINLYGGLKENYFKTIETLAAAIEAKDEYTQGHSSRVSKYSLMIAQSLDLSQKYCEDIEIAGILHDIGKIGISDYILSKPGRLTEQEYAMMTNHPIIGSKILENVGFSEVIMNSIKFHHKRYDLKGYPKNIELDELPLEACIVGVSDAFDAMTSNRSYRTAITLDSAIDELVKNKGTQFDPNIVDVVVDVYKNNPNKIKEIVEYETMVS